MKRRELKITDGMHNQLVNEKKASGENVSTIIRIAIREYLTKAKKERDKIK